MSTARYQFTVTDERTLAPIAGMDIYVYDQATGVAATMTDDLGQPLTNPLVTDTFGVVAFNAVQSLYRADFYLDGRLRYKESNIVVGDSNVVLKGAPPAATRAGKFLAYDADGNPIASSGTGADAGLRADLAAPTGASLVDFLQSGTGATPRTSQAKMRDVLNISDYCAGDGVTDDGPKFALLCAYAEANGLVMEGKPGATYLLATWTPRVTSGVFLLRGNWSVIKGPASSTNFVLPTTRFVITECQFERWGSVVTRLEADTGSIDSAVFMSNICTGITGIALNIERPLSSYMICNNEFSSCSGGYVLRIGNNTVANQDTWKNGVVSGNIFTSITASGTASCAPIILYGLNASITGNVIDGVSQTGTGECWGIYTKLRYCTITGNVVKNVVASGNGDNVGINIKGLTRAGTASPQGFSVTCVGNQVKDVGVAGTRGVGIRGQTDDVIIADNLVENPGLIGITSDEAAAYRNVLIDNNQIRWNTNVAATIGITVEGQGTYAGATGNLVTNARTGIFARASAADLTDAFVIGNRFAGCTNNIIFDAATGRTLTRLIVDDNVVADGTFGILNNGSSGTVTGLRMRRNDFIRAGTPVSGLLGTSPEVADNIGFLRGSTTYDPPSLADGEGVTTTVSVPALAPGDFVQAAFSVALAGVTVTAWCSAANTASVRFQNESGGTVDLASGTLRVIGERRA
jgi:hypothetical protein